MAAIHRAPFDDLLDEVKTEHTRLWKLHLDKLNGELRQRAAPLFTRLVLEDVVEKCPLIDPQLAARWSAIQSVRFEPPNPAKPAKHASQWRSPLLPVLDPVPELDAIQDSEGRAFANGLLLWQKDRRDLVGFGGELDRAMQMPGWTNVWTMPIQNRVDMLATGVNTDVGVRVLGRNLNDVVAASNDIAAVLKNVRGAADVVADPIRGKGYLEVRPNREQAASSASASARSTTWSKRRSAAAW